MTQKSRFISTDFSAYLAVKKFVYALQVYWLQFISSDLLLTHMLCHKTEINILLWYITFTLDLRNKKKTCTLGGLNCDYTWPPNGAAHDFTSVPSAGSVEYICNRRGHIKESLGKSLTHRIQNVMSTYRTRDDVGWVQIYKPMEIEEVKNWIKCEFEYFLKSRFIIIQNDIQTYRSSRAIFWIFLKAMDIYSLFSVAIIDF